MCWILCKRLLTLYPGGGANDRVTDYTYDRMGRTKSETRRGVASATVDAGTGALATATGAVLTTYEYDGLSNVTRKTDATAAATDWKYDGVGRKTSEQGAGYVDYLGNAVRPTTDYEYDGLNHIKRQLARGTDNGGEADDRITVYTYGAGGYLSGQTDPSGAQLQYRVDGAGNIVRKTLVGRLNADNAAVNDVTHYWYNQLGREIRHLDVGTGTSAEIRYNSFGDITGKRTNGAGAETAWAELSAYDAAGRAWLSNTGDGITKVYLYDANGNATLKIEHTTTDLRLLSLANILALADTKQTISVFDARNQLVDTVQAPMVGGHNLIAAQQALNEQQSVVYAGGGTNLGVAGSASNATGQMALITGEVGISSVVTANATLSSHFETTRYYPEAGGEDDVPAPSSVYSIFISAARHTFRTTVPDTSAWGGGKVRIHMRVSPNINRGMEVYDDYISVPGRSGDVSFDFTQVTTDELFSRDTSFGESYTYTIEKDLGNGVYLSLGSQSGNVALSTIRDTVSTSNIAIGSTKIMFRANDSRAKSLFLMTRLNGTNTGWKYIGVPNVDGQFQLDWSGLERTTHEYRYVALDAGGNVLNSETGTMLVSDSAPSISQQPLSIGGAGRAFMDAYGGRMHFTEQGASAQSLSVRYRAPGSTGLWSVAPTLAPAQFGGPVPGWFVLDVAAYGIAGAVEYVVEARNGAGQVVNKASGTFVAGNANSVSGMSYYTDPPEIAQFGSQPTYATRMVLRYRVANSGAAFAETAPALVRPGVFNWDTASAFHSYSENRNYEFQYETYAGNVLINKAHGVIALGGAPALLSCTNDSAPTLLSFTAPAGNPIAATATHMAVEYNLVGSGTRGSVVLARNGDGVFVWDASAVIAPGTGGAIAYAYTLRVGPGGNALLADSGSVIRVAGTLNVGPTAGAAQLTWISAGATNTVASIHRSQKFNAFGEVAQETDNLNGSTDLSYNTLGKLVLKQDPAVGVTLANGFQKTVRPATTYYYDGAGRLLATRDANGNLAAEALLAGTGSVAARFNADGGKQQNGYDVFGDARYRVDEMGRRTDYSYDKAGRLTRQDAPARADGKRAYDIYTYDAAGNRISHATTPDGATVYTDKTFYDSLARVTRTVTPLGRQSNYGYVWDTAIQSAGGLRTGGWRKTVSDPMGRSVVDDVDAFGRVTKHTDLGGRVFTYAFNRSGWLTGQTGSNGQNISYTHYANGYVKSIVDNAGNTLTVYEYDAAGNRTYEAYSRTVNGVTDYLQNSSIEYDSNNRVTRVHDPRADIRYEYDAAGNRRRVWSYYHDGLNGDVQLQDYWYAYDNMNRFTVTMGKLSSPNNTRALTEADAGVTVVLGGAESVQIGYTKGSERDYIISGRDGHREDYTYGREGYLEDTYINAGGAAKGALRARRGNDWLGRAKGYEEFNAAGASTYVRQTVYDADNRQASQSGSDGATTYYYYAGRLADGGDDNATASATGAGELAHVDTVSNGTTSKTWTRYAYWDQAKQTYLTISGSNPVLAANDKLWKPGLSSFTYDVNGHLASAVDAGLDGVVGSGDDVRFEYVGNAQGLVLKRDQMRGSTFDKRHRYLYVNGAAVGDVGNDGDQHLDYAQGLAQAAQTPVSRERQYKDWRPVASADFDQNYQPINRGYPAAASTSYTVKRGDTLESVAVALWGDASMWYLIAEANGLAAGADLAAGQTLVIPNKVTNIHNTSRTMRPYDAGAMMGDTGPTLPEAPLPPPPPQPALSGGGGCGGLGMIIVAIIVVVVSFYTAGAASAYFGAAEGTMTAGGMAAGAAAGNAAGQLAGMAMGTQDSFNWGAVATSAFTAAATFGVAGVAQGVTSSSTLNMALGAAAQNVASQGIGLLTGQQKSFSWASVAASAFAAPLMAAANENMFSAPGADGASRPGTWMNDSSFGSQLAQSGVSALVSATTRMAIVGGRLSWQAVAADAIGSAIGRSLGNAQGQSLAGASSQSSLTENPVGSGGKATLTDLIAQANAAPERGAMNYTDYGYSQQTPLAERLGLTVAPQMSVAAASGGGAPGSGGYMAFSTNLPETPSADVLYEANATYHRNIALPDPLEAAAVSDRTFYQNGEFNAANGFSAVAWHFGGLLNETGYDLAKTGRGAYQLATDANTRAAAYGALKYAVNNPGAALENTINGVKNFSNKPFAEQADSVFKFAAGGLATAGVGKAIQIGVSPIMQGGKWALETGYVGAQDYAVKTWLRMQSTEALGGTWQQVYESAADGTRRLGFNFNDLTGFRAVNSEPSAKFGNFLSLERPMSPGDAIERSALIPEWRNMAGELYEVEARRGVFFKGIVAPQNSEILGRTLGGGNTQIFQTKVFGELTQDGKRVFLPTWNSVKAQPW